MPLRIPTMVDRRRKITDDEILKLLKSGIYPVWTSSTLADELDITRQTANNRLKELAADTAEVASITVGQATAYYCPGVSPLPPGETREERVKQSIIREYTDKFVGLQSEPWTAVHPNDGPAEAGDKIQIQIHGEPRQWTTFLTRTWENRREELIPDEIDDTETQALISGELYERPTVPIEHISYPDDYDLELNLGAKIETIESDGRERKILVASGVKNYLLRPVDDAVFLTNVSVDWISLEDPDAEVVTAGAEITDELLEEVAEWREEHVNDDTDAPSLEERMEMQESDDVAFEEDDTDE